MYNYGKIIVCTTAKESVIITGVLLFNFTLDFIPSFKKQGIILFLQLSDVAESLVQNHVLTLDEAIGWILKDDIN